ncbi:hypothetical protein M8J75_002436 [Diaphorina citri]|nr:hypothetical protein M8J75_002436 [Diaphorina citri]
MLREILQRAAAAHKPTDNSEHSQRSSREATLGNGFPMCDRMIIIPSDGVDIAANDEVEVANEFAELNEP